MFLLGSVGWTMAQTEGGSSTIYVNATYSGGDSNGSEGKPYTTLANAISAANNGDIIILAPGTYADTYSINKAITIKGGDTKASKESTEGQNAVVTGRFQLTTTGSYTIENVKFVRESSSSLGAGTASVEMNKNNVTLAVNNCCFINDKYGTANSGAGSSMCVISGSNTSGCALTIKNTEMYLNGAHQRGFSDRSNSFTSFVMEDSKILSDNLSANIYNRPIAIYSGTCSVKNSVIEVGHGYCITVAGSNMTCSVENSELKGFATLYIFQENNDITVSNSILTGVTQPSTNNWFGTITFENAYANKLSVTNSVISNFSADGVNGHEYLIYFNGWSIDEANATSKKNTVSLTNTKVRTTNSLVPAYVMHYPATSGNTVELIGDGNTFSYNLESEPITKDNQETVLASDKPAIVIKDSQGSFINATATLQQAIEAVKENQIVVVPAGEYALSSQLTINKAITLEGADMANTVIKATGDWSVADNLKDLVNISGGESDQTVTLKNLTIKESKRSGLNAQTEMNTVLVNVKLAENAGAGMIVHSPVTANGLITEGNTWGGVNVDKGDPTYTISFTFMDNCVFNEVYPIYSDDVTGTSANYVTTPQSEQWTSGLFKTVASEPDSNGKFSSQNKRVWSDGMIVEVSDNGKGLNIYANGQPVTVSQGLNNCTKFSIGNEANSSSIELPSNWNLSLFGGSKDADVENTSITMTGGQVARIYGGGYGYSAENKASVTGKASIKIEGGSITSCLVGGGNKKSTVNEAEIVVTGAETKIAWIYAGGFASSAQPSLPDAWENTVCGVKNLTINITDATITGGLGCGGGQSYCYTGTSTITTNNANIKYIYGTVSNGYANEIHATFNGGSVTGFTTMNRGQVGKATFTFNNCTFPEPMTTVAYMGATRGWANSDWSAGSPMAQVNSSVTYSFNGCTNTPYVYLTDGITNANVTLNGTKAIVGKFNRGTLYPEEGREVTAYAINESNTWSLNNGLELTSDVTLTQTGTLVVNGTMKVATAEQAAEAILKGNAAVIDASTLTADAVLTKMGSTEATLKKGIKVIFSDNTAYTDSESAKADLAGAKYIYWDNTNTKFVMITPSKDTPTIDKTDKPVGSTIDAGMPISASVLKGGSAKVEDKVVAGTFAWVTKGEDGKEIVAKEGTNEYDVIFTPQDQIRYASVKTTAKIENVRQYYMVEPGVCANGTVEIVGEHIAHKYPKDTTLAVTAKPAAHYQFKAWSGLSETSASISYKVTESKTLVAEFEPIKHTVSFGSDITVMKEGAPITSGDLVAEGTVLTVTASKDSYALTSLTCNNVAIINNQVTVDKDLVIAALFESTQQPIVTVTATNGKVMLYDSKGNTIALGSEVAQGTVVTIVAVPDLGYKAGNLTATGVSVENNQFTMGASDVALTQTFNKLQFEVKTVAENATITLDNSNSPVVYGTTITLSAATAKAGYKLLGVFVNGKEIKQGDSFTVTAATTVQAVTAQLPAIQFVDKDQTVTYNGQPQAYVPNTVPAGISGFTIKYNGSETVPTNAGSYTVNITRNADDVYAAVNASFTFKIKKAKKNVGIPTALQVPSSPADNQFYWIGTASNGLQTIRYQLTAEDAQNYYVEDMVIATTEGETTLTKFKLSRPAQTTLLSAKAALRATAVNLTLMGIGGSIEAYLGSVQVTESTPLYAGQTITLVARPNAGNSSLATWTGATNNGDGTATLTLGNEAATVTATFAAKGEAPINRQSLTGTYNGLILAGLTIEENALSNNWRYSFEKAGVTIDNPINAGVYDIVAKRSEDEMYAMTETTIGTLTINPAESTVSDVTATSILPNETLNQSVLSGVANVDGVFTWKNPDTQLSATTTNVPVLFTPTSSNYKSVQTIAKVEVRSLGATVTPRTLQLTVTGQEMGEAVTITLDGATVVSGTSISAGQTLKVTYAAKSGYRAKATINGSSYSSGNAYTIPDNAKNVEIKVEYYVYVAPNPDPTPDPDPVIPTVSNPVVAERTATTAAVTWEKVSGATSYKLFLYAKKTDSTPLKIYEFDKDGKLKATAISFTLTGLEEGKAYYVETAAYNASGTLLVKKSVELSATPTGIEAISEGSQLYTVKGAIVVAPAEPLQVAIYSVTGQTLFNDEVSYLTQVPAKAGIYVVVIQKGKDRITEKVIVK